MCVCDMNTAVADFPVTIRTPQATRMIGTSASVNGTAYASDCITTVFDDWFFELRLESTRASLDKCHPSEESTGNGNGPFNKGDDGIAVGQAYLGYKGFPGTTFDRRPICGSHSSGRPLVWDDDITLKVWRSSGNTPLRFGGSTAT